MNLHTVEACVKPHHAPIKTPQPVPTAPRAPKTRLVFVGIFINGQHRALIAAELENTRLDINACIDQDAHVIDIEPDDEPTDDSDRDPTLPLIASKPAPSLPLQAPPQTPASIEITRGLAVLLTELYVQALHANVADDLQLWKALDEGLLKGLVEDHPHKTDHIRLTALGRFVHERSGMDCCKLLIQLH